MKSMKLMLVAMVAAMVLVPVAKAAEEPGLLDKASRMLASIVAPVSAQAQVPVKVVDPKPCDAPTNWVERVSYRTSQTNWVVSVVTNRVQSPVTFRVVCNPASGRITRSYERAYVQTNVVTTVATQVGRTPRQKVGPLEAISLWWNKS